MNQATYGTPVDFLLTIFDRSWTLWWHDNDASVCLNDNRQSIISSEDQAATRRRMPRDFRLLEWWEIYGQLGRDIRRIRG